jgi:HEAT repeat protein
MVSALGAGALTPLAALADAPAWRIRWSAAVLLGRTGQVAAVAPLQAVMR